MICDNIGIGNDGILTFAGQSTEQLANQYGTPLYLMDEDKIRFHCRQYLTAVRKIFGEDGARVLFASKAASYKQLYRIMKEEGMGIDVVSPGEIYTAKAAGFPLEKAFFHSNNKSDSDILFAMENGVGFFVADNLEELKSISKIATERGSEQKVLLRLTPGIDPHTFAAVSTGQLDSKFGFAIQTGQAEEAVSLALSLPGVSLVGYHCHIGSQVFDSEVFLKTADIMLSFSSNMRGKYGFAPSFINLGGGFGVPYTEGVEAVDIEARIAEIGSFLSKECEKRHLAIPVICFEPGRSIVADAGMTLYTVGSVKTIPGCKTYVSVDGGMTDNPRVALYDAKYTVLPVKKSFEGSMVADVAGRCCESGDILQRNVSLPADIQRGDRIAFLTTGAYHYSMASNYNRVPKPPVVMLTKGTNYIAVRRETEADVCSLDI